MTTTPTFEVPVGFPTGAAYFQLPPSTVKKWMSLPAPAVLPSGLPNVWSMSLHFLQGVTVASPNLGSSRTTPLSAVEMLSRGHHVETTSLELAPFNVETMRPFFEDTDYNACYRMTGSISVMNRFDTMTNSASGKDRYIEVIQNAVRWIITFFTNIAPPMLDRKANPKLLCSVSSTPGTYRPHAIVLHDAQLASLLYAMGPSIRCDDIIKSMNFITLALGLQGPCNLNPLPKRDFSLLCCYSCHSMGTDRQSQLGLKRLSKCHACGLTW